MEVGEQQPVVAAITRDSSGANQTLQHLRAWAEHEHGYEKTFILYPQEPDLRTKISRNLHRGREWQDRNAIIRCIEEDKSGLAERNPIIHFMHYATKPYVLSPERAADILRSTQEDAPRLVGGFVLNSGMGIVPDNYRLKPGQKDPFINRVLDEIIDYSYDKPEDSPLERTYPIQWAHPYNLAMPYSVFKEVGGFPLKAESPRLLTKLLADTLGVKSVLLPLIAMEIGPQRPAPSEPAASGAGDAFNFDPSDSEPARQTRRSRAALPPPQPRPRRGRRRRGRWQ